MLVRQILSPTKHWVGFFVVGSVFFFFEEIVPVLMEITSDCLQSAASKPVASDLEIKDYLSLSVF